MENIGGFIICTVLTVTRKVKKLRKMKMSGNMAGQNTCIVSPETMKERVDFEERVWG